MLHSLRHTFGTRLGESGADAFTIMRLMRHSTGYDFATICLRLSRSCRVGVRKADHPQSAKSRYSFRYTGEWPKHGSIASHLESACPGGGTGRHKGLKIRSSLFFAFRSHLPCFHLSSNIYWCLEENTQGAVRSAEKL